MWKSYLPKLYKGQRPVDFDEYRATVVASLRRPGYAKAFSQTTRTDHTAAEQRLTEIDAPTLVVMGELDPDFKDPRAEAEWICRSSSRPRGHGARGGPLPPVPAA